jgi:hypothetical protein
VTAQMSRQYILACNGPGCNARFWGSTGESRATVRRHARADRSGAWTHVHEEGMPRELDQDYCPLHKPVEHREKAS